MFNLDSEKWHVNVQPVGGMSAIFAVLLAFMQPKDKYMGLSRTNGGYYHHNEGGFSAQHYTSVPFYVFYLVNLFIVERRRYH